MTNQRPGQTPGAQIRDARVRAGLSLRELARRLELAPSYLNDIEHDRRVPSEPVLKRTCAELPELDEDLLMAAAGRVGEAAEEYIKANPTAGVLLRRASDAGLDEQDLKQLLQQTDRLISRRDRGKEPRDGPEREQ